MQLLSPINQNTTIILKSSLDHLLFHGTSPMRRYNTWPYVAKHILPEIYVFVMLVIWLVCEGFDGLAI